MDIIFLEPYRKIPYKENKSKLLEPSSQLYKFVEIYRNNIIKYSGKVVANKLIDSHIQILNRFEASNITSFLSRVKYLSRFNIDINDVNNYGFMNKAFVLFCPYIPCYGRTHITIAYFKHKKPRYFTIIKIKSK